MVLKQGDGQYCFLHDSPDSSGCSGAETLKLFAAKLIVEEYFKHMNFTQTCLKGEHKLEKLYDKCTISEKGRGYDGHYPGDVPLLQDGKLKALIEVKDSRAPTGGDFRTRVNLVGPENVWEIDANTLIEVELLLFYERSYTKGVVNLDAINIANCQQCMETFRNERGEKNAKRKKAKEDWEKNMAERKKVRTKGYEANMG